MNEGPYKRFADRDRSLSDELAIERTMLASERTVLAYGRTSLAMLVVGASAIGFFDALWLLALGLLFIVMSIALMLYGWLRYRKQQTRLRPVLDRRE